MGADRSAGLHGGASEAVSPAAPSLTALMSLTRTTSSPWRFVSGLIESEKARLSPAEIDCEDIHTHTGALHRELSCYLSPFVLCNKCEFAESFFLSTVSRSCKQCSIQRCVSVSVSMLEHTHRQTHTLADTETLFLSSLHPGNVAPLSRDPEKPTEKNIFSGIWPMWSSRMHPAGFSPLLPVPVV